MASETRCVPRWRYPPERCGSASSPASGDGRSRSSPGHGRRPRRRGSMCSPASTTSRPRPARQRHGTPRPSSPPWLLEPRITVAVRVLNVYLRHPYLLAGQLAVAQATSRGRLDVGLGAGSFHLARHDHEALAIPFPHSRTGSPGSRRCAACSRCCGVASAWTTRHSVCRTRASGPSASPRHDSWSAVEARRSWTSPHATPTGGTSAPPTRANSRRRRSARAWVCRRRQGSGDRRGGPALGPRPLAGPSITPPGIRGGRRRGRHPRPG